VIKQTTVVNVTTIKVYRNVNVHNAVVAVRHDAFGRQGVHEARVAQVDVRRLEPVRGQLKVTPEPASYAVAPGRGARPPDAMLSRPVVATRRPPARIAEPGGKGTPTPAPVKVPAPKIVPAPKPAATRAAVPARPPLGTSPVERPRRAVPPRFEGVPQNGGAGEPDRDRRREAPPPTPGPGPGAAPARGGEAAREPGRGGEPGRSVGSAAGQPARQLPGEPANRLSTGRGEKGNRKAEPDGPGERGGRPGGGR
jgi:hypothetical protein